MAISTFAELKIAVGTYADIDGNTATVAQVDDAVMLATALLNYGSEEMEPLRTREMLAYVTLTPDVNGIVTLPSDYLQYRDIVSLASERRSLQFIAPSAADYAYPTGASGLGINFALIGDSVSTYPTTSQDVSLLYYQAIPDLSDANPTNWLLTKNPNVYLHATLFNVGLLTKDDSMTARSATLTKSFVAGMRNSGFMAENARPSRRLRIAP